MSEIAEFRRSLAVVIGIDRYGSGVPALRTAVSDARRVGELLADGHGYAVRQILDADATLDRLRSLFLEELPAEVGPEDRVFLYFAGHGVALDGDQGPNGYLLPQDARRGEPDTYLHMPLLHDALLGLHCRHLLVVLDSCFSGAFRWSSLRDLEPLPGVIHRERFERYLRDPAWQVITSSAHDQTALDRLTTGSLGVRGESGGHSPFALSLFEALEGRGDLVPQGGDGVITATELYLYLEQRLQTETLARGLRQTPRLWPLRKHDKGEYIFLVPGRSPDLPPAPPLTFDNNPYRGLSSYDRDDADLFFGRGRVVAQLSDKVADQTLTIVLGASGTGKSSVVKAGLVPDMAQAGWHIAGPVRPGAAPLHALADAVGATQPASAEAIADAVARLCADSPAGVLLVVDQLEELVTLNPQEDTRQNTLGLLAGLLTAHAGRLRIVLTLRSDFEAQFDRSALAPWWNAGRYVVPPPSREELREIIEQPASRRVFYFQPASLVDELIDAVVATPGGLPLLSFTLSELYLRYVRRQSADRALTHDDYVALGGVVGALRSRADAEYEALDDAHRATLRRVMLRMVVPERESLARRRVARAELDFADVTENERVQSVVARFTAARLLVEGTDSGGVPYVEPAHDALVLAWGRLLTWIHEEDARATGLRFQHELARTAAEWEQSDGRTGAGLLWRDAVRSGLLAATLKDDATALNRRELAFARRSVRRRRAIRNGLAGLVAIIVFAGIAATVLGIVAEDQRRAAVEQRDEAVRQTLRAQSNQLNAQAVLALDGTGDASKAVRLSAAALRLDGANTEAARTLLRSLYGEGVFSYRGRRFIRPTYRETDVDPAGGQEEPLSQQEHFIAAEGMLNDHSFEYMGARSGNGDLVGGMDFDRDAFVIRDTRGGEVGAIPGGWSYADFTRDGRYLVTGALEGEVVLWELPQSEYDLGVRRLVTLGGHTDAIYSADFSADEMQVVTTSRDGTTRYWELTARPIDVEQLTTPPADPFTGGRADPSSADGSYTVRLAGPDTVVVIATASGDTVARRHIEFGLPRVVDISPDGARVYTEETNGIAVWDWREPRVRHLSAGFQMQHVVVTPEGMIATHAINGTTRVWDASGREIAAVRTTGNVAGIEVRDSGRVLAVHHEGADYERLVDVLPLDPEHLLTVAWGGIDTLTAVERERWAIGESGTGSLDETAQPTSLLQVLRAGLRARLPGRHQTPVTVDSTRIEAGRQAWAALDAATACTGAYPTVRMLISCAQERGALTLLEQLAGTPIFLEGPHAAGAWDPRSDGFGQYNPAFVAWAADVLVPRASSPVRRVAQSIYDRWLRDHARTYLYARLALQDRPELRAQLIDQGVGAPDPGRSLFDALFPLGDSLQAGRGVDAVAVAWAGTFWIRRALDGTEGAFASALDDLLARFDPGFREAAAEPPPLRTLAAGPETAFLAADAEASCENVVLDFGVRARYCAARRSGLVDLLAAAAGEPVFLGGPHAGTRLDLEAADDFGRYNPAFIRWAHQTLIPDADAAPLLAIAAPIYERRMRTIARSYWLAWRALEARPDLVERVADAYLSQPDPGRYIQAEMSFLSDSIDATLGNEAADIGHIAGGFWVRRHLDGSSDEFVTGLRKLLEAFDGEWLDEAGGPAPGR